MMYPRPAGETPAQYLAAQIADIDYRLQDEPMKSERAYMEAEIASLRAQLATLVGELCVVCTRPARTNSACCCEAHEDQLWRYSMELEEDDYGRHFDCWSHARGWFDAEQEIDAYEAHENLHNS